ncbi:MAG: hypothetical protein OEU09_21595, partial [Rhodospirillales bacterium]|nr:hypothetical protein [Rhodospirillales bacterium]
MPGIETDKDPESAPQNAEIRGACHLVAGMVAHETFEVPGDLATEAEKRAFLRGFRFQFGREVSRVTRDETFRPKPGPCGRGRSRFGPRAEWRDDEAGLAIAAAALIPQAEIARRLNRTHQAVRNLLA